MNPDLQKILVTDLELDPEKLQPEAGLEDAGLDSLSLVELSVLLGEQSGVYIDEADLAFASTIAGLDRLVSQRLAEK